MESSNMRKRVPTILSLLIMIVLSSCGAAKATPDTVDIYGTALALAETSVAFTKAAMPTATPFPTLAPTLEFTATPFPTLQSLASPTSLVVAVPTNTQTNPCNEPPPSDPVGTTVRVRFVNKSKGLANLAFGMLQENDEGECGTYNFTIGANTSPEVTVLAGCYWGFAWIAGTDTSTAKSFADICLTDPNQVRGITITKETIGFD